MYTNAVGFIFRFGRIVALCSVFMLGGCLNAATNIPYAGSAPPEKLCTLNIVGTLTVKQFDGEKVDWSPSFGDNWATVQVPEGSHTFMVDYSRTVPGGQHTQNDITVSGNFIAGRTYRMLAGEGAELPTSGNALAQMGQMARNIYGRALQVGIVEVSK